MSLFGSTASPLNPGAAPNASTSNFFGSLNVTSQPNQQSSPAPAGTGLFGLGGSIEPTQQPQQQSITNAPSLFAPSPLGPSQLANQTQSQPQTTQMAQPLQQQQQQQQPSQSQSQSQQQPQNGFNQSTTSAAFHSIIERNNKRKSPGDGSQFGELPSLHLGLSDISSKLRNLGGTGAVTAAPAQKATETRARDLLAASGIPRGSTLRDLSAFGNLPAAAAPPSAPPLVDTDIEAHMDRLQAKSAAARFEEAMEETNREFDDFLDQNFQINWDEQRRRIHEHFGIIKPVEPPTASAAPETPVPSSRGAFGVSSQRKGKSASFKNGGPAASTSFAASGNMSRSILGTPVGRNSIRGSLFTDVAEKASAAGIPPPNDDPWVRTKQEKYAAKINELNASRKEEKAYPLIEQLAHVEIEAGSDTPQHLVDAYRALKKIVNESSSSGENVGPVREREFAKDYLDEAGTSGRSVAIRKQILEGSRKFLEDSFFQHVEDEVTKNPREANLGGVPSKINKVRAYLRIRAARKDLGNENSELQMLGDDYCWGLLFHLLRCGLAQDAAKFVTDNERALKAMDRHFGQYMMVYARDPERRLPREMQNRINAEYSQRARLAPDNSIDPYRMACYKIVGRCDLAHKQLDGINPSVEDWLWLIFSLAREVNRVDEAAGEYFGLDEARGIIETIGQRHFTVTNENSPSYSTFFLMQVLAGMFEKAVAYLYPYNYVAAVHFAIALDFYGLLRVSDVQTTESNLLTVTTRGNPQISFGRLLGYYTQDFRLARAEAATDYIVLICLNTDLPGTAGESQRSICQEALKDLVLETREFHLLLGDIQMNGQRIPGAIETRLPLLRLNPNDDFLKRLTLQAASVADDNGRVNDAVALYHLAEDFDSAVVIINQALSDALSTDYTDDLTFKQARGRNQDNKPKNGESTQSRESQPELSMTSIDDPAELARRLVTLYNAHALYFKQIRETNRTACGQLLCMSDIKRHVDAGRTSQALDLIIQLDIVPLRAEGNVSRIRSAAQAFNLLPQVVARNIGHVLLWTIGCLGRERQTLMSSAFQASQMQANALLQGAKDLMVFAGLIRYKLPPDVFEVLAKAGQNVVGAY